MISEMTKSNDYLRNLNLSSVLVRCCTEYFGIISDSLIKFQELKKLTEDLNDYKNVAAIAYYSLDKNDKEIIKLLDLGLKRISNKKVDYLNYLIFDSMAIFSITVAISRFNLIDYSSWIKDIIFENIKFNHQKGNDFGRALDEFLTKSSGFTTKNLNYSVTKIWLENNINNRDNVLELQSDIAKKIWLKGVPIFEEEFFNIISIAVINTYIDEKFKSGIVTNERKYQQALIVSNKHSKVIALIIILIVTILVTIVSSWFFYKMWQFEARIDAVQIEQLIKWIIQILGVISIPFSFYKYTPKIYQILLKRINSIINIFRGLS